MKSGGYNNLFGSKLAIVALLAIGAVGLYPIGTANAQDATLPTKEVNITLNQAPVRTALDTLFKSAGLNYTIDPDVTGLVTVSLRAIPFDVALRSILRSSQPPLSFTVDDGIYDISLKDQAISVTAPGFTAQQQAPDATATASTTASTTDESTATQVVPLRLEYANANLILRYALAGTATGYIPSLDVSATSGNGNGGMGGMGGMNGMSGMGGMGGMSGMGGMGGMSGMGGMGGYGGGMSTMGGMGGYSGGMSTGGYGGGMSSMGGYR